MSLLWLSALAFIGGMLIGLIPIIPKWLEVRRYERKTQKIINEMKKNHIKPRQALDMLEALE